MPNFTQGEWKCDFEEDKYIWSCDEEVLGELYFTTPEETKANARLIASAPEMYDELYEVLQFMKGSTSYEGDDFAWYAKDIAELLARIDGEECHDKTNLDC